MKKETVIQQKCLLEKARSKYKVKKSVVKAEKCTKKIEKDCKGIHKQLQKESLETRAKRFDKCYKAQI